MYGIRRFQFAIAVLGMILGGMEGCFGENTSHFCACNKTEEMIARIDGMMENLGQVTGRLQDSKVKCDLVSGCKCFIIREAKSPVTKAQAKILCADIGGKLADMDTKKQYNNVLAYGPKHQLWANLWTGMRYVNKKLELSYGSTAPYVGWHKEGDWPNTNPERSEIVLAIRRLSTATNQGMINVFPKDQMSGSLCEME